MSDENTSSDKQIVIMPSPQNPVMADKSPTAGPKRRTIFNLTTDEFSRLQFLAKMYAQSSFNAGSRKKNEGDYFLIMMKGIEVGFSPMAAVENIDIIGGEPVIDAKGLLGLTYASGYLESIDIDSTKERCVVTGKRVGYELQMVSFTMQDAKGLSLSEKPNWKSQPEIMLKWRAVTKFVRQVFPDISANLYTREEMDNDTIVHADGSMIASTKTPAALPEVAKTGDDESIPKAWHEDPEKLALLLGHCKARGWIEGETISEQSKSLVSLLGKEFSTFETGKAASEAAEAEFTRLSTGASPEAPKTSEDKTEAWDTLDGIAVIVNWAKGKGYGDNEPALLKLLAVADWKAFDNGRQACEAIAEAYSQAQQSAEVETTKTSKLSDIDCLAINAWAMQHFAFTPQQLRDKLDVDKFSSPITAKTVIKQKAAEEHWAVMSEKVTHIIKTHDDKQKKYLSFETVLGELRWYKGRSEFHTIASQEYVDGNGIKDLPADEQQGIEPILLSWRAAEGYNEVYDAMPVLEPIMA